MKSDHKFFKVKSGICHFAHVWFSVDFASSDIQIIDCTNDKLDADAGEVNAYNASSWVKAAIEGAEGVLTYCLLSGHLQSGCLAKLERLIGSFVDTREDAVRCAASLAVWRAVCPDLPLPSLVFEANMWRIELPPIETK